MGKKWEKRRARALNIETLSKNKYAMLSDSTEGQIFNLVIFLIKTRFNEELNHKMYFFVTLIHN